MKEQGNRIKGGLNLDMYMLTFLFISFYEIYVTTYMRRIFNYS